MQSLDDAIILLCIINGDRDHPLHLFVKWSPPLHNNGDELPIIIIVRSMKSLFTNVDNLVME